MVSSIDFFLGNLSKVEEDHRLIDEKCICPVSQFGYTGSYLNTIVIEGITECHIRLNLHFVFCYFQ